MNELVSTFQVKPYLWRCKVERKKQQQRLLCWKELSVLVLLKDKASAVPAVAALRGIFKRVTTEWRIIGQVRWICDKRINYGINYLARRRNRAALRKIGKSKHLLGLMIISVFLNLYFFK
jgi:hypothetical protein